MTGVVQVDGNRLCEKFEGYFQDRMTCGYVYHNAASGQVGKEYTHVTPGALKFFSIDQQ
jgi:adenylate cyclase